MNSFCTRDDKQTKRERENKKRKIRCVAIDVIET